MTPQAPTDSGSARAASERPAGEQRFRVAEALAKDAGRGIARLDPHDLAALELDIGDVLELIGKQSAFARAMPAHTAQRGQRLVQMDGILRANAGASLDEQIRVRPAAAQPARSVVLAAAEEGGGPAHGLPARYLAGLLEGIPVAVGNRVRVTAVGRRRRTFCVTRTDPPGAVLIGPATTVRCQGVSPGGSAVTYEDIGGLHKQVHRVREIIELPLRYPGMFAHLGIEPPKGVLLHGPPGTGKTLIARAVADEAGVRFVHVNGPEIMDKWYGASEAHLRQAFEEAERHAPAFIFIDELDAIAPQRTALSGERQVERRVVAQLLALMDGLVSRGEVIVVGATNIPDALEPALRRPGRFDREIEIDVPDKNGRREILEIHSRDMPLADDVDLQRLAAVTHGFVGADLAALCREAAMAAVRRMMPEAAFAAATLPEDKLAALRVERADFEGALGEVQPSALREIATQRPETRWSDVGGLDEVKAALYEAAILPLTRGALYEQLGIRPPRAILLHGAPGTGKTLLAKALAGESEANFVAVQGPQLLSMWAGETERAIREIFRKARQAVPCIVLFDEIDALAPRRGAGGENPIGERIVAQLLVELDGIEDLRGIVVLAATNRLDRLDPALIRAGRFDSLVELTAPDRRQRLAVLEVHTRNMSLAPDVSLDDLASATEGYVGADLAALCRKAALSYLREHIARENAGDPGAEAAAASLAVPRRCFEAVLEAGEGQATER